MKIILFKNSIVFFALFFAFFYTAQAQKIDWKDAKKNGDALISTDYEKAVEWYEIALKKAQEEEIKPIRIADLVSYIGIHYQNKGNYAKADSLLRRAVEIRKADDDNNQDFAKALYDYAYLCHVLERLPQADSLFAQSAHIRKTKTPEHHRALLKRAEVNRDWLKFETAENLCRRAMELHREHQFPDSIYAEYLGFLADIYTKARKYEQAEQTFTEAANLQKTTQGETHLARANTLFAQSQLYYIWEKYDKAEIFLEEVLKIRKEKLGENDLDYVMAQYNLARLHHVQKRFASAEKLYQETLPKIEILEGQTMSFAKALLNWAELYFTMSEYNKSEQIFLKILDLEEKLIGRNHLEYAQIQYELAEVYLANEQYSKAEPLYLEAYKTRMAQISPQDESLIKSLHGLANLYFLMKKHDQSEAYYEKTLEAKGKQSGEETIEYARLLGSLAVLHTTTAQYAKAEPLFGKANGIFKKWDSEKGNPSLDYATNLSNWAILYRNKGNYKIAEEYFQEALKIQTTQIQETDPAFLQTNANLATLYAKTQDFPKAEALYQKIGRIYANNPTKNLIDYAFMLNDWASLYSEMGRYADSKRLFEECIGILKQKIGENDANYAIVLNNWATLLNYMGDYEEAEKTATQALQIQLATLGESHPDLASTLNNLASIHNYRKHFEKVEPILRQVLEIRKKYLGESHPEYATALNNLAELYLNLGQYTDAEPLYRQALDIRRQVFGETHLEYAAILNNLGKWYYFQEKYKEAEPFLQQTLDIRKAQLDQNHPDLANTINSLAVVYQVQKKYTEAEPLFLQSLQMVRTQLGEKHPNYATGLNNLANLYSILNRYDTAEIYAKQALEIRQEVLGEEHPDCVASMNNLANIYVEMGRYNNAEHYFLKAIKQKITEFEDNFAHLSDNEKKLLVKQNQTYFENFNIFCLERAGLDIQRQLKPEEIKGEILGEWYNVQLQTKAMLLTSANKMRKRIVGSGNHDLIAMFRNWQKLKDQTAKLSALGKAEIVRRRIDWDSLQRHLRNLEKNLSMESQDFREAFDPPVPTWQDIKKRLKPQEVAIEIIRMRHPDSIHRIQYVALIITPETEKYPAAVLMKYGREMEIGYLKVYLNKMRYKYDDPVAYDHYWKPIRQKLDTLMGNKPIKKIYFSPDGAYNQISLNTLQNFKTKKYVLDESEIHILTNTKEILTFSEKPDTLLQNKTAVLVGRPSYALGEDDTTARAIATDRAALRGQNFTDLEGTETEVRNIKAALDKANFRTELYLQADATEEAVKKVRNPYLLHIATHGFFMESNTNPPPLGIAKGNRAGETEDIEENKRMAIAHDADPMLRSGLALAGASSKLLPKEDQEDGILTAFEAMSLELDSTNLVTFSACETAKGEVMLGEGVYGLQRALMVAGAQTLLMSLWKVDDAATQELMNLFYAEWLRSTDKRKAFHYAQSELRKKYKQPYFWGAFVMIGE